MQASNCVPFESKLDRMGSQTSAYEAISGRSAHEPLADTRTEGTFEHQTTSVFFSACFSD